LNCNYFFAAWHRWAPFQPWALVPGLPGLMVNPALITAGGKLVKAGPAEQRVVTVAERTQCNPYVLLERCSIPLHSNFGSLDSRAPAGQQSQTGSVQPSDLPVTEGEELTLYAGWRRTLPVSDHEWILKTVFTTVRGKIEPRRPLQLWYNPPPPQLLYNQPPRTPDRFFANKLFYWAPYHMFAVKLICPEPKCNNYRLTNSSTSYEHTVRQVLDLDGYYSMASEYLECTSCRRRFISGVMSS
jgi:hypothetical protein